MWILYVVHDLSDPAVARRVRFFTGLGAEVAVAGFQRGETVPQDVAVHRLGTTGDGRLVHRAGLVVRQVLAPGLGREGWEGVDVVVARSLEMLVVAARLCPAGAKLVYECLDIHRLMLSRGLAGRVLRAIEGRLLRRCAGLIVSSPGFLAGYFQPVHGAVPPVLLLENKVAASEVAAVPAPAPGPPWRVLWAGMIRCRRSLVLLAECARALPGQVEVVMRGRVSRAAIPDFDALVAGVPGLRFLGPYDRRHDLVAIHAGAHFVWAVDYYEAGGNSEWLLPNRLYEGAACGAVPIARAGTETARWLQRHGAGIVLDGEDALPGLLRGLDAAGHAALRAQVLAIPAEALMAGRAERDGFLALVGA